LHDFLAKDQDELVRSTVHPQEDPRLEIPREFLEQYLALVHEQVAGVDPRLVYTIDETGCSDWEERGAYDGIIRAALKYQRVHFAVTRKIKHQTMLICINAADDSLSAHSL
jgi:hypothetical protein